MDPEASALTDANEILSWTLNLCLAANDFYSDSIWRTSGVFFFLAKALRSLKERNLPRLDVQF